MSSKSERAGAPTIPVHGASPQRTLDTGRVAAARRGVSSLREMREEIKRRSRLLPELDAIPRIAVLDAGAFRARAQCGLPFIMVGLVDSWPLATFTPAMLQQRFPELRVRARAGDYVKTAFSAEREMVDIPLLQYFELVASSDAALPPYLGNQSLPDLDPLCAWPRVFEQVAGTRFWLGPAGTVTPLHCDFDDNLFAQAWGRKQFTLFPPHEDEHLYTREVNPVLFGSPFDPDNPDFVAFPLAKQARALACTVQAGELLYLPAGWFHQVRALEFSLSANRWARTVPFALRRRGTGG